MANSTTISIQINKNDNDLYQYFTKEELDNTAKELSYIEEHPEEYESYNDISELKKALLSDEWL